MELDVELFITTAEIAGIFVGFGALIGFTRRDTIETSILWRIRGLVSMGLVVIVYSLIPIGLSRYGIYGHALWFTSGLIFFLINWAFAIWSVRNRRFKMILFNEATSRLISWSFWLLLEVPIQVSLILILFGFFPDLEPGLYTTALFFSLFECAFILSMLVYSSVTEKNN